MVEAFKDVYEMPYTRASPWLLGILFGYEVACIKRQLNRVIFIANVHVPHFSV